jgi:hypothetical protein
MAAPPTTISVVFSHVDPELNARTLAVRASGTDATDVALVHDDIEFDGDGERSTIVVTVARDGNTAGELSANVSGATGVLGALCATSGVTRSNSAIAMALLHPI